MAKKYWGRYKIGGKWDKLWHLLNIRDGKGGYRSPRSLEEARRVFVAGTRFKANEYQITTKEPAHYAGRNPRKK